MYTGGLNIHNNRKLPNINWEEMDEQHEYDIIDFMARISKMARIDKALTACKAPNMNLVCGLSSITPNSYNLTGAL